VATAVNSVAISAAFAAAPVRPAARMTERMPGFSWVRRKTAISMSMI